MEGRLAPGKATLSSEFNVTQQQRDVNVEVGRIFNEEKILSQQQRAVQYGALGGDERERLVNSGPTGMTGMCKEDYYQQQT